MYAFIQARMGSSRLPGKMAMTLPDGKSLLEAVLDRLAQHNITPVLLTTRETADDQLAELAKTCEIPVYRGDEKNVLNRFTQAAEAVGLASNEFVLRVCADNPFLSHYLIDQTLIECTLSPEKDYISLGHAGKPGIKHQTGIFVEAVKLSALNSVLELDNDWYNEHVTVGIYENPQKYDIHIKEIPVDWHPGFNKIRLTIDDINDWNFCFQAYSVLSPLDFAKQRKLLLSEKKWVIFMENQITKYQK